MRNVKGRSIKFILNTFKHVGNTFNTFKLKININ